MRNVIIWTNYLYKNYSQTLKRDSRDSTISTWSSNRSVWLITSSSTWWCNWVSFRASCSWSYMSKVLIPIMSLSSSTLCTLFCELHLIYPQQEEISVCRDNTIWLMGNVGHQKRNDMIHRSSWGRGRCSGWLPHLEPWANSILLRTCSYLGPPDGVSKRFICCHWWCC